MVREALWSAGSLAHALFQVLAAIFPDHKHFKSQEIPPAWQLMRDARVRISQAAAEMPLNRS